MEDGKLRPIGQLLPLLQGVERHPSVDLAASIAQPDDTRLTAGARAGARRAIGVEQKDPLACPSELPGRPGAEDSSPNDRDVVCVTAQRGAKKSRAQPQA